MSNTLTMDLPARTASAADLERRFGGIDSQTWRKWARQGRLTTYRVSPRRMLFDLDEVERLVREARVPAMAHTA